VLRKVPSAATSDAKAHAKSLLARPRRRRHPVDPAPPVSPASGCFGGSFVPVHVGHLILAETAIDQPPARGADPGPQRGSPPTRRRRRLAPVADRLAMLRLAVRGNPKLTISRIEADHPGRRLHVPDLETLNRAASGPVVLPHGEDKPPRVRPAGASQAGSSRWPASPSFPRPAGRAPEGHFRPSGLRAAARRRVVTRADAAGRDFGLGHPGPHPAPRERAILCAGRGARVSKQKWDSTETPRTGRT